MAAAEGTLGQLSLCALSRCHVEMSAGQDASPSFPLHPDPAADMALHTWIDPPPCLTVSFTCLGWIVPVSLTHTQVRPSEHSLFILVSSDHTTRLQSSTV
ncbi:hypothetical protein G6F68_015176 [Rhizopus microsporus]|nr:hypothetical protein G6F67_009638 [Rhizopus microsporus]KAG1245147.1 hypothetical protein G6F68_015176 [Rhizopus microsporus]